MDCNIHPNCGGGTKRLKQSECQNSTCCQVGNIWVTLDKDECKLKQQDYANGQVRQAPQVIQVPQIQIPQIQPIEPPNVCCKQKYNSFTRTYDTECTKQWVCY